MFRRPLVILVALACTSSAAWPLTADQLLLVVNRNVPESRPLAEFYAAARSVPAGRIVELDLPRAEQLSWSVFEGQVVRPLRQFLRNNALEQRVACLVTFYGVPLRLAPRAGGPEHTQELAALREERRAVLGRLVKVVEELEQRVSGAGPSTAPAAQGLDDLAARAETALATWAGAISRNRDESRRAQQTSELVASVRTLAGPAAVARMLREQSLKQAGQDGPAGELTALEEQVQLALGEISRIGDDRGSPAARARLRQLSGQTLGLLEQARMIQAQLEYLEVPRSGAAVDSELALLWWNAYPVGSWHANPLHWRIPPAAAFPRTLMVMRLDAPQPAQVRQMILAGLRAEQQGLRGRVVLDSRGLGTDGQNAAYGSLGWYDQGIRDLASLLAQHGKLPLLHDDLPEVLAEGSADNVAVYCGWYSLRKYVAACRFLPGAVGFHVASFELQTLLDEPGQDRLWVRGLIEDGVVATIGAVDEPYLAAFPAADEFFPLLLTGQLPLAEVYWKTTPMVSWMMTAIGDPLYTPFARTPALAVEDLPARLRPTVSSPPAAQGGSASRPADP